MRRESSLVFAGVAPHPPIMVPEVGGPDCIEVQGSIDAMAELTRRIIASGAKTVVLISPHAPLDPDAFVAYRGPNLQGDFSRFGAPDTRVESHLAQQLFEQIQQAANHDDIDLFSIQETSLDHGTSVPLYFLDRNGWQGRVVALGYSFRSMRDHLRFGECIREAADVIGEPTALIASGDLSHRLKPDAPAGYHPFAYRFDEQVVQAIESNQSTQIIDIDPQLRKLAGECGYRSMIVALGATKSLQANSELLHYEAPFGVGYMVAQLTSKEEQPSQRVPYDSYASVEDPAFILPNLARQSVETYTLTGDKPEVLPNNPILETRAACFVSIKTLDGELRGCIGTVEPTKDTLAEELVANAISAASRDPRFSPVEPSELENLRYSVDILSPAEPASMEELDPKVYGVVVEDVSGFSRGLLLPDIEGVSTAEQQVEIAARKAGIPQGVPLRISRFRVVRYREQLQNRER
jgi:MEMO1 family protein